MRPARVALVAAIAKALRGRSPKAALPGVAGASEAGLALRSLRPMRGRTRALMESTNMWARLF